MYVVTVFDHPIGNGVNPSVLTNVKLSPLFPESSLWFFEPVGPEKKLPVMEFSELCRQGFCGKAQCSIRIPSGRLTRHSVPYVSNSTSISYLRSRIGQAVGDGILVSVNFVQGKLNLRN